MPSLKCTALAADPGRWRARMRGHHGRYAIAEGGAVLFSSPVALAGCACAHHPRLPGLQEACPSPGRRRQCRPVLIRAQGRRMRCGGVYSGGSGSAICRRRKWQMAPAAIPHCSLGMAMASLGTAAVAACCEIRNAPPGYSQAIDMRWASSTQFLILGSCQVFAYPLVISTAKQC